MNTDPVMVVLSGGQDSTTVLLEAVRLHTTVHCIAVDYGQRHNRELDCAEAVADMVGVSSFETVRVPGVLRSRSPLTDPAVELETYTDFGAMDKIIGDRVELTFVPLRNPFFLLLAANYALAHDCYTIATGVCAMDNANYPDCTPQFVYKAEDMMNEALGLLRPGSARRLKIWAPLLNLTKAQTVRLAMQHPDWEDVMAATHTCYAGEYPPCGKCHSCVLRAEGFRLAGVPDPLVVAANATTS